MEQKGVRFSGCQLPGKISLQLQHLRCESYLRWPPSLVAFPDPLEKLLTDPKAAIAYNLECTDLGAGHQELGVADADQHLHFGGDSAAAILRSRRNFFCFELLLTSKTSSCYTSHSWEWLV